MNGKSRNNSTNKQPLTLDLKATEVKVMEKLFEKSGEAVVVTLFAIIVVITVTSTVAIIIA